MSCVVILYVNSGIYSLTSTPNDRFLRNFSRRVYLLSEILSEICWEEIARKYFFFFIFRFDIWPGILTPPLNLISQHTTYWITATSRGMMYTSLKSQLKLKHLNLDLISADYHLPWFQQDYLKLDMFFAYYILMDSLLISWSLKLQNVIVLEIYC